MTKNEVKKWAEAVNFDEVSEYYYRETINWSKISEEHLAIDFIKAYANFEDGDTDLDIIHVAMFELIEWLVNNVNLTKYQVGILLNLIQNACFDLNELERKLFKSNKLNHFENGKFPVFKRMTKILDVEDGYSFEYETVLVLDEDGNRETNQCCYSKVECY